MSKKILFLVNTPYQLMVTVGLRMNEFSENQADIVISDNIADYMKLSEKVRESGVFENVYTVNIKSEYTGNFSNTIMHRLIPSVYEFNARYDIFLFANLDHSASDIYRFLRKRNKKIAVYMFEDGLASYSGWYSDFLCMFGSQPKEGEIFKRLWIKTLYYRFVDNVFLNVDKMFLLMPEIITYNPRFEIVKMNPLLSNEAKMLELYNRIFGYDGSVDRYEQDVIFFEESYFADEIMVNDVELVEKIASLIGKDKIFVKIHPRNPINRFKELGYMTNSNMSIPWEVIAMNIDLSEKTLVSIASVAVIEPSIMLKKKYKGILLFDILENDDCLKKNIINLYRTVCEGNDKIIFIPHNESEFMKILRCNS